MQVYLLPANFAGDPEVCAMLQAFYSRSKLSIVDRLENLGSDISCVRKALKKFYLGYGHSSIADCGSTTLFFENVSLHTAMWLVHHPLFSGQECSTRYIDFSNATYDLVTDDPEREAAFVKQALQTYKETVEKLTDKFKSAYENPTAAELRGCSAKAFDIARCLLPVTLHTNVAVTMSLRNLRSHLTHLLSLGHLPRVQEAAKAGLQKLLYLYPSSFAETDLTPKAYTGIVVTPIDCGVSLAESLDRVFDDHVSADARIADYIDRGYSPFDFTSIGWTYTIDVGCWREVHRHRKLVHFDPVDPIVSRVTEGMHSWYIRKLTEHLGTQSVIPIIKLLDMDYRARPVLLGDTIKTAATGTVGAFLYFLNLRKSSTVHPILRDTVREVIDKIKNPVLTEYLAYKEYTDAQTIAHRGTQTILNKE